MSTSKKQGIPISPLKSKDLNITSSSSCSTQSPKGCFSFFLSNHSSAISKNASSNKNPNPSPNFRDFRGKLVKKYSNLPNPDCFSSGKVKKNPNLHHQLKLGETFSSKYDLSDGVNKFTSGFQFKLCDDPENVVIVRKPSKRYDFFDGISKTSSGFDYNAENVRKPSLRCDFSDEISKNSSGFDYNAEILKKFSSRYDISDENHEISKRSSVFDYNDESLRKPGSKFDISDEISKNSFGFGYDAENVRKCGSRYAFPGGMNKISTGFDVKLSDSTEDFTPVNKLECGSGSVSSDKNCVDVNRNPTPPPVQASVSPEILGGLTSVVPGTPTTCYGAGNVLSGVTDKRKCRPEGILTIGSDNLFASSKTKGFRDVDESVVEEMNNSRDSVVPSPTEASVCWLSSPCDEKRSKSPDDDGADVVENYPNALRLNKLAPFKLVGISSSPSSSPGFSSELFDKSNCSISTSDANTATPNSRKSKSSILHSDLSSEFRGLLGPSLDHLVCSSSTPSPNATCTCNVDFSPEEGKSCNDHESQVSHNMEYSLGSRNVMQTPESDSRPSNFRFSPQSLKPNSRSPHFGLSDLSRDQISRLWFECELDSVAQVLRRVSLSPNPLVSEWDSPRTSFEFNPLIKLDKSDDLTLLDSLPDPEVRISWREGLASRLFEMNELDCCRYLSDEDDNANCCSNASEFYLCPEIPANASDKIAEDSIRNKDGISRNNGESPSVERRKPCTKSIDHDGRYEPVPEDSSWTVCYKNHLFQV